MPAFERASCRAPALQGLKFAGMNFVRTWSVNARSFSLKNATHAPRDGELAYRQWVELLKESNGHICWSRMRLARRRGTKTWGEEHTQMTDCAFRAFIGGHCVYSLALGGNSDVLRAKGKYLDVFMRVRIGKSNLLGRSCGCPLCSRNEQTWQR